MTQQWDWQDTSPEGLKAWRREKARRIALGENYLVVNDQGLGQYFSDLWFYQAKTTSREVRQRIVEKVVSHWLGFGWARGQQFIEGEPRIRELVRLRLTILAELDRVPDYWQKRFPALASDLTFILTPYFSEQEMAKLLSGIPSLNEFEQFWSEVAQILPGIEGKEHIDFLAKTETGVSGVRTLLLQFVGLRDYPRTITCLPLVELQQWLDDSYWRDVEYKEIISKGVLLYTTSEGKHEEKAYDLLSLLGLRPICCEPDFMDPELDLMVGGEWWSYRGFHRIRAWLRRFMWFRIHGIPYPTL